MSVDHRRIEFRSDALDPAARNRIIQARRDAEINERIALLRERDYSGDNNGKGRPLLGLPAEVAQMILDDIAEGRSLGSIVREYRPFFRFSRRWLSRALSDGRLEQMAGALEPSGA